jgi:hypothetical protein
VDPLRIAIDSLGSRWRRERLLAWHDSVPAAEPAGCLRRIQGLRARPRWRSQSVAFVQRIPPLSPYVGRFALHA